MNVWTTPQYLSLQRKDCIEKSSPFGDPLWHSLPVDFSPEDSSSFLNAKQTKDETSHMKEEWAESSRKSVQSVCYESDDDTTNTSLNESKIMLQKLELECASSLSGQRNSVLLTDVIPIMELAEKKCNELTNHLKNEKKGFINVAKLAEMIANSLGMESISL